MAGVERLDLLSGRKPGSTRTNSPLAIGATARKSGKRPIPPPPASATCKAAGSGTTVRGRTSISLVPPPAVRNAQVGLLGQDVDPPVVHVEHHAHLGVAREERRQHRREQPHRERERRVHAQGAAGHAREAAQVDQVKHGVGQAGAGRMATAFQNGNALSRATRLIARGGTRHVPVRSERLSSRRRTP